MEARSQPVDFHRKIARDIMDKRCCVSSSHRWLSHALQYISPDWINQPNPIVEDKTVDLKITSPESEAAFDASPDKQLVKVPLNFEGPCPHRFPVSSRGQHERRERQDRDSRCRREREGCVALERGRKVFYTRQQEVTLCGTRAGGELKVATRVGRFAVPLELAPRKQKVRIDVSATTSYTPPTSANNANRPMSGRLDPSR